MPLEPSICPILHDSIPSGDEFILLSGHAFDARALAIWVADSQYGAEILLEKRSARDIISFSLELSVFAQHYRIEYDTYLAELLFSTTENLNNCAFFWMQETVSNPFTQDPLTLIEKRALGNKISLLNHQLLRGEESAFSFIPEPRKFTQYSLREQYKYLKDLCCNLQQFHQSSNGIYWAQAQLAAYAISILAPQLVAIPNKMEDGARLELLSIGKYASRNPENGSSVIWQLTQRLLNCLAFDERNLAVMNLVKALPKERQLSFMDFVREFLTNKVLTPRQVRRFSDEETGHKAYQTANTDLMNEITKFSLANHTAEAISADHGRFARSGFEAPLNEDGLLKFEFNPLDHLIQKINAIPEDDTNVTRQEAIIHLKALAAQFDDEGARTSQEELDLLKASASTGFEELDHLAEKLMLNKAGYLEHNKQRTQIIKEVDRKVSTFIERTRLSYIDSSHDAFICGLEEVVNAEYFIAVFSLRSYDDNSHNLEQLAEFEKKLFEIMENEITAKFKPKFVAKETLRHSLKILCFGEPLYDDSCSIYSSSFFKEPIEITRLKWMLDRVSGPNIKLSTFKALVKNKLNAAGECTEQSLVGDVIRSVLAITNRTPVPSSSNQAILEYAGLVAAYNINTFLQFCKYSSEPVKRASNVNMHTGTRAVLSNEPASFMAPERRLGGNSSALYGKCVNNEIENDENVRRKMLS